MIFIKIKRVMKAGFVNFWRNGWVSLAAILVVVITLFMIGSTIFAKTVLEAELNLIQDKVDISAYFKNDAEEKDILALRDSVAKLSEVKSVEYISADKALADFKERHKDNATILQSIEELDKKSFRGGAQHKSQADFPIRFGGQISRGQKRNVGRFHNRQGQLFPEQKNN